MARRRYQRSGKAKAAQQAQKIAFSVGSLDPLAQGVSHDDQGVCFVAKTLPGERGTARVMKKRSGVRFARVEELQTTSPVRIEPECPHYGQCPGCHYLHTDYAQEIEFKQQALLQLIQRAGLSMPEAFECIAAPQRFEYRNRMQLHYRHKHIGMVDAHTDKVLEIPQCKLLLPALQEAFQGLYSDKSWHQERGVAGHCELYFHDGETRLAWDQPYAQGGFTQVNAAMNEALKELLQRWAQALAYDSLLDLFAGDGNLSDALLESGECYRAMVDYGASNTQANYFSLDLYADDARQSLRRQEKSRRFDLLLLDPPRKGLPELADWLTAYRPAYALYVSCNPATLARDLKHCVPAYSLQGMALLDLFPGTQHFESVALLVRKS